MKGLSYLIQAETVPIKLQGTTVELYRAANRIANLEYHLKVAERQRDDLISTVKTLVEKS